MADNKTSLCNSWWNVFKLCPWVMSNKTAVEVGRSEKTLCLRPSDWNAVKCQLKQIGSHVRAHFTLNVLTPFVGLIYLNSSAYKEAVLLFFNCVGEGSTLIITPWHGKRAFGKLDKAATELQTSFDFCINSSRSISDICVWGWRSICLQSTLLIKLFLVWAHCLMAQSQAWDYSLCLHTVYISKIISW